MADENKQLAIVPQITEVVGIIPKLIVAGNIKVGGKGETKTFQQGNNFQLPIRFNHFKLTTTERGSDGNLVEDKQLTELVKKNGGITNPDGNLTGIPVVLMWDDTNLNFPYRRACYVGGNLACQGNGEEAYSLMDKFTKPIKCPCHKGAVGYSGKDKCKFHGKLTVIIEASLLFGQVYKFTTTGENSIKGILAGIELIKRLTNDRIAGLPLMLTFNNHSTVTPTGQNTTVPVVGLCFRGSMVDMRRQCIELFEKDAEFSENMKRLETSAKQAGDGLLLEDADEESELIQEFFPHEGGGVVIDVESSEVIKTPESAGNSMGDEKEDTHQEENSTDLKPNPKVDETETVDPAKVELFERLQGQSDPEKALALARRNDVPHLIKYFKRYLPSVAEDPKIKKPALLEAFKKFMDSEKWDQAVADYTSGKFIEKVSVDEQKTEPEKTQEAPKQQKEVDTGDFKLVSDPLVIALAKTDDRAEIIKLIKERFPNKPLNLTEPPSGLIAQAKRWLLLDGKEESTKVSKTKPVEDITVDEKSEVEKEDIEEKLNDIEKDPRYYALQGEAQVAKETIPKFVKLKKQISRLNDKKEWFDLVAKFVGVDEKPVESATMLTQRQGDFLIELLQMEIDGVPF